MKYEIRGHIDFEIEIEAADEASASSAAEMLEFRVPEFPTELGEISVEVVDVNVEIDEGPDPIED